MGLGLTASDHCLSCGQASFADILSLGSLPLANAYPPAGATAPEPRHPLELRLCEACTLVQLRHVVPPESMFSDYLYFSSYSTSMLRHAEAMVTELLDERRLGAGQLVVEVASNDGYLLQYFDRAGVPVLGIEPAANVADVARRERGINTLTGFFGSGLAADLRARGTAADVIIGLNVMAHVPDLNGFVEGIATLLAPGGVAVIEVPYVRDMIERTEFDTIYHEHLSYFSVQAVAHLVERHGLVLERVRRVPVHGGSLRLDIGRGDQHGPTARALLAEERALGLHTPGYYAPFRAAVERIRADLRGTVARLRAEGATIAGYGAAAKATILLNYCGFGPDDLAFVADRSEHKQGRRMPGCGIPIVPPESLRGDRPDYVLLFVWNIRDEVLAQEAAYRDAGGRFIVAIPRVEIL